jgi:hypothetical protein
MNRLSSRISTPEWQERYGSWLLVPRRSRAIIHFLGGAFIAAAPHLTYRRLLEFLGRQGFAIVATPFVSSFNHSEIADEVLRQFDLTRTWLERTQQLETDLPVFGLGHSMGSKLHLLIGSLFTTQRWGNVLVSFNNYAAKRSIPLLEQLLPALDFDLEFTPAPAEMLRLIDTRYAVPDNLLVKFRSDDIDQTRDLSAVLQPRFPQQTTVLRLPGNHLTPTAQELGWQPSTSFTPLDAVSQWIRQEVYRDLDALQGAIAEWLLCRCESQPSN